MSHMPAGGPRSKNVVHPNIKTGSGSHSTNPGYVSQLGNKVGSHISRGGDSGYRGEAMHTGRSFDPVEMGNKVALNVGKGGCGTGRTLYGQAGSQGQHGQAAGDTPAQSQDTLAQYGPERSR